MSTPITPVNTVSKPPQGASSSAIMFGKTQSPEKNAAQEPTSKTPSGESSTGKSSRTLGKLWDFAKWAFSKPASTETLSEGDIEWLKEKRKLSGRICAGSLMATAIAAPLRFALIEPSKYLVHQMPDVPVVKPMLRMAVNTVDNIYRVGERLIAPFHEQMLLYKEEDTIGFRDTQTGKWVDPRVDLYGPRGKNWDNIIGGALPMIPKTATDSVTSKATVSTRYQRAKTAMA